jgi:hypothetical protein
MCAPPPPTPSHTPPPPPLSPRPPWVHATAKSSSSQTHRARGNSTCDEAKNSHMANPWSQASSLNTTTMPGPESWLRAPSPPHMEARPGPPGLSTMMSAPRQGRKRRQGAGPGPRAHQDDRPYKHWQWLLVIPATIGCPVYLGRNDQPTPNTHAHQTHPDRSANGEDTEQQGTDRAYDSDLTGAYTAGTPWSPGTRPSPCASHRPEFADPHRTRTHPDSHGLFQRRACTGPTPFPAVFSRCIHASLLT